MRKSTKRQQKKNKAVTQITQIKDTWEYYDVDAILRAVKKGPVGPAFLAAFHQLAETHECAYEKGNNGY